MLPAPLPSRAALVRSLALALQVSCTRRTSSTRSSCPSSAWYARPSTPACPCADERLTSRAAPRLNPASGSGHRAVGAVRLLVCVRPRRRRLWLVQGALAAPLVLHLTLTDLPGLQWACLRFSPDETHPFCKPRCVSFCAADLDYCRDAQMPPPTRCKCTPCIRQANFRAASAQSADVLVIGCALCTYAGGLRHDHSRADLRRHCGPHEAHVLHRVHLPL